MEVDVGRKMLRMICQLSLVVLQVGIETCQHKVNDTEDGFIIRNRRTNHAYYDYNQMCPADNTRGQYSKCSDNLFARGFLGYVVTHPFYG